VIELLLREPWFVRAAVTAAGIRDGRVPGVGAIHSYRSASMGSNREAFQAG
jgi:hypothetical protein